VLTLRSFRSDITKLSSNLARYGNLLYSEIDKSQTFKAYNSQRTTSEGAPQNQSSLAVYSMRMALVNHKRILERVRRDKEFMQKIQDAKKSKSQLKKDAAAARLAAAAAKRDARAVKAAAKADKAAARLRARLQRTDVGTGREGEKHLLLAHGMLTNSMRVRGARSMRVRGAPRSS